MSTEARQVVENLLFDRVQASYARCLVNAGFFDRFYEIFMATTRPSGRCSPIPT